MPKCATFFHNLFSYSHIFPLSLQPTPWLWFELFKTKLSRKVNSPLLRSYRSSECLCGLPDFASLITSPERSAGRWLWFFTGPALLLSMDFSTPPLWIALDKISAWERYVRTPNVILQKNNPGISGGSDQLPGLVINSSLITKCLLLWTPIPICHKCTTTIYKMQDKAELFLQKNSGYFLHRS